ncbi:FAD-dependent oxidoreductase [Streptomyces sp. NPDC101227]|uniref:FAD-dependent oxidoreductase n=1 Tax=Streptomyces sp. NPDC101227 TaxID=3366136 RepID=UPI00381F3833
MTQRTTAADARQRTVLISGASVAGPALAYWLARYGYRPTVIEVAPDLRGGGFAVDFRGAVHTSVLKRMGVLDAIKRRATGGSPLTFIDAQGRRLSALPPEFAAGELEILRSDLSRILYEHSLYVHSRYARNPYGHGLHEHSPHAPDGDSGPPGRGTAAATEYVFGDSVASLTEGDDGVHVTFDHGAPRTFDLVVGADGLHSTVRRLAFGPDEDFVSHLGYYVAGWDLPADASDLGARPVGYSEPGRLVAVGRTPRRAAGPGYTGEAFCLFASDLELPYDRRDPHSQKKAIAQAYAGSGWRTPELIDTLWTADELYFDALSRVDAPHWSTGRTVLLGDAAHGATVGGMGTGSALVGAYVLAGELALADGDHTKAFARYERLLRPYVTPCQEGGRGTGEFLAPTTQEAIDARNAALNDPATVRAMLDQGTTLSAAITLPDYPSLLANSSGGSDLR